MKPFISDKVWNFAFTVVFISITIVAWKLFQINNINLNELTLYDLFIIGLATFRLTRLLIYDEVFYYVKEYVKKFREEEGFIKSVSVLLTCPWCVGVWMAMLSLVVYELAPYGKFILLILSLSAIAGLFHLIITLLGWEIGEKKNDLKNKVNNDKLT